MTAQAPLFTGGGAHLSTRSWPRRQIDRRATAAWRSLRLRTPGAWAGRRSRSRPRLRVGRWRRRLPSRTIRQESRSHTICGLEALEGESGISPALLIMTSMRPNAFTAASTNPCTSSHRVTSVTRAIAFPPPALSSFTSACIRSNRLAPTATHAPCAERRPAVASRRPLRDLSFSPGVRDTALPGSRFSRRRCRSPADPWR